MNFNKAKKEMMSESADMEVKNTTVLNEMYWKSNLSNNRNGKSSNYRDYDEFNKVGNLFKVDGKLLPEVEAIEILRDRLMDAGIYKAEIWTSSTGIYNKAEQMGLTNLRPDYA